MTIQFNLLPDVKKQYVDAKRKKRLIMSVSTISAGAAIALIVVLFSVVQIGQKSHINRLGKDITMEIANIRAIEDLDKILTIQHQLETLPELHTTKTETSRLFSYLNSVTPVEVKISSVNVDFVNYTMIIEGTADSLAAVNKYADTLKFVTYSTSDERTGTPFTNVITESNRNEERATYEIGFVFDPLLFDNTIDVSLVIPERVTTRSIVGKPGQGLDNDSNSLFEDANRDEEAE